MTMRISICVLLMVCGIHQITLAADKIVFQVTVKAPNAPSAVNLERVGDMNFLALDLDASSSTYSLVIPIPNNAELTKEKLSAFPYLLVGKWQDETETVYLTINSRTPRKISFSLIHPTDSDERATLERIRALGSDFESVVERYFRARSLHRKWRNGHRMPDCLIAIQSAIIWFDASSNLAKLRNSYFRLDDEIVAIMQNYAERSKTNQFLRSQLASKNLNYINATIAQVYASQFSFVGEIPNLVSKKEFLEAQALNNNALAMLEKLSSDEKNVVSKYQKINLDMLRANAAFISTKQNEK